MRKVLAGFVILSLFLQVSILFTLQTPASGLVPQELLTNGNFDQGLQNWLVRVENGSYSTVYQGPNWLLVRPIGVGFTDIQLVNEPGRTNVLDINQPVNDFDGDWTGVYQILNKTVSGYSDLYFEADGKAIFQSLPGDGFVGGEYPVHFIIRYMDVNNIHHNAYLSWPPNPAWQQGFYYLTSGDPDGFNSYSNIVRQNVWFHYMSPNLMNLNPVPKIITAVHLYSSGWAYHGRIDNARLYTNQPPTGISLFSDVLLILPLVVVAGALMVLRQRKKHF